MVTMQDDSERLQLAMQASRPHGVSRIVTHTGLGSTGDPAVWTWVSVDDEAAAAKDDAPAREAIRQWAEGTARRAVADSWPCIAFRTETEQREFAAEQRVIHPEDLLDQAARSATPCGVATISQPSTVP
jgi:hypothetical protein